MTVTVHSELLCLLNLAKPRPQDASRILSLAQQIEDWDEFFELTIQNSALIWTARQLRQIDFDRSRMEQALQKNADLERSLLERAQGRSRWAAQFLDAAFKQGIEVIVLKGGLLGSVLYGDPAYKKMNDIDVLVQKSDAPRFAQLLRELRFSSVGMLLGKDEFEEDSHHCPPFVSEDLLCMVGIHWGLTSPYSVWKPDYEEIWKNRVPAQVSGVSAYRMSWEENLLHLCIHLPFFKIGVRELADVYNLVLFAEPKLDWARFDRLVSRWKAEDAAYRVISLANTLIECSPPQEMLNRWEGSASRFTLSDTQDRLKLGCALISTRSVQIGKIEKAFSIFRITESYSERVLAWLMTWKLTFWPSSKELPRIVARYGTGPFGILDMIKMRLLAGSYCWRAMARDYGQLALTVITLINIGIVFRETILRPFRKSGESIRKHPAAKLLEALE